MAKIKRESIEMSALEAILEQARSKPLSDEQHRQLRAAITTLAFLTDELEKKRTSITRLRRLLFGPTSEKRPAVLKNQSTGDGTSGHAKGKAHRRKGSKRAKGHGRNGADAYTGAKRIAVNHDSLNAGDSCPDTDCTGKVYRLKEPGTIVRIQGLPPLPATVYALEKLRCNLCGTVFTAPAPEGVGEHKFDETAASMLGLLRYGAGFPFKRLETLQGHLGIPLPASTQWETVEKAAASLEPVFEALIDQAAQGEVLHNDDTPMKILALMKENANETKPPGRTGMFTSGIISRRGDRLIALFFTGRRHAGENLEQVLKKRAESLEAPIQMCDGLSRNLTGEFKTLVANCITHGRRRFVEVVDSFPEQCEHILESLGEVYRIDAIARQQKCSPQERLKMHQDHSAAVMAELKTWFDDQFENKKIEPNSSLGEAVSYMQRRWDKLTLFLREPGAPLDNNICERALKKAILHRKGSLFYKTQNGARVGDLYMSLIHTAELAKVNPFDYLCELQRHAGTVNAHPDQWMPWNYRQTLTEMAAKELELQNRPVPD